MQTLILLVENYQNPCQRLQSLLINMKIIFNRKEVAITLYRPSVNFMFSSVSYRMPYADRITPIGTRLNLNKFQNLSVYINFGKLDARPTLAMCNKCDMD